MGLAQRTRPRDEYARQTTLTEASLAPGITRYTSTAAFNLRFSGIYGSVADDTPRKANALLQGLLDLVLCP